MTDSPKATTQPGLPRRRMWACAIVFALVYASFLYLVAGYRAPGWGQISVSFLIGAPVGAACLTSLIIDPKGRLPYLTHVVAAAIIVGSTLVAGVVAFREGGVCVVMAIPLFLAGAVIASLLMRLILGFVAASFYCFAILALPLLAVPAERQINYPSVEQSVVSTVDIEAPAPVVWRNLVDARAIEPHETAWTFTQDVLGVPKPTDARMVGEGVGAVRYASWGSSIHFKERVLDWRENRSLAWAFDFSDTSIPKSVEGHIKVDGPNLLVERGGYSLTPLSARRTRVTLTTTYLERTPFNAYCAWWGRVFIRDFHANVLHVIRRRAEAQAARPNGV